MTISLTGIATLKNFDKTEIYICGIQVNESDQVEDA